MELQRHLYCLLLAQIQKTKRYTMNAFRIIVYRTQVCLKNYTFKKRVLFEGAVEQELLSGDELFKELVMINFVDCNLRI